MVLLMIGPSRETLGQASFFTLVSKSNNVLDLFSQLGWKWRVIPLIITPLLAFLHTVATMTPPEKPFVQVLEVHFYSLIVSFQPFSSRREQRDLKLTTLFSIDDSSSQHLVCSFLSLSLSRRSMKLTHRSIRGLGRHSCGYLFGRAEDDDS